MTTPVTSHLVGEIIFDKKVRSSKTRVTVELTGPGSWIEQEPGWMTICHDHGRLCLHDTRTLALSHASHPEGWCGVCAGTEREDAQ